MIRDRLFDEAQRETWANCVACRSRRVGSNPGLSRTRTFAWSVAKNSACATQSSPVIELKPVFAALLNRHGQTHHALRSRGQLGNGGTVLLVHQYPCLDFCRQLRQSLDKSLVNQELVSAHTGVLSGGNRTLQPVETALEAVSLVNGKE